MTCGRCVPSVSLVTGDCLDHLVSQIRNFCHPHWFTWVHSQEHD